MNKVIDFLVIHRSVFFFFLFMNGVLETGPSFLSKNRTMDDVQKSEIIINRMPV